MTYQFSNPYEGDLYVHHGEKKRHSWKACPSNYQPNTNIGLTILFLETQEFQLCRDFLRFKSPLKPAGRVRVTRAPTAGNPRHEGQGERIQ